MNFASPTQYIPAVEKGVREVLAQGAISGHPIVDVRVTLLDGKHHTVDSKEIAFIIAARKAMVAAMSEARAAVLEPMVHLHVLTPHQFVGDITGDLNSRRAMVNGTHGNHKEAITVSAVAPLAELTGYQARLNALTSGLGTFTLAFSHYEPAAPAAQHRLVSEFIPTTIE